MQFDIITIFPEIFNSYFKESIIKRAVKKGLIKIKIHNLRNWAKNRHQAVDDRPYGGGIGMVLKIEPIYKAIAALKKSKIQDLRSKIILFTPRGKKFNQKIAHQFSKLDRIIMICGRYEGIDERVASYIADEKISIGDYVLMGGELPVMVMIETMARLIPGVLGKPQLLKERIPSLPGRGGRGFIEYPQYTRPEVFSPRFRPPAKAGRDSVGQVKKGVRWQVPKVLLSGNHKKIAEWRKKHQKIISS